MLAGCDENLATGYDSLSVGINSARWLNAIICAASRKSKYQNSFQSRLFPLSERHPCLVLLRPSSELTDVPSKLARFPSGRGEDAEPHLRASNEGSPRPRVARATEVGVLTPPPSPLGLRRRPVQFRMSAAVEAGEAVTGFASGIRHGGKGDGGVIEGACGLIVEEMHFSHHRDRGAVPRWHRLFFAGNLLLRMTLFAFGFIRLNTSEMGAVVGYVHRSTAARLGTGDMFVL